MTMEFGEDYVDVDEGEPRPRRRQRRKPKPRKEVEPADDIAVAPAEEIAIVQPPLTQWPLPPVTDLYLLRADHGRRPIDWLWRLSTYFLQRKRKPWKKLGCVPLRQLVAFRERMLNCVTDHQREGLQTKYRSLYEALEIAKQPLDHPVRQALELLILGNLPVDEIAGMLSLRPYTVLAFEETFYDVRSRLTEPSFTVCEALRYHDHDPLTQLARELRHLAYCGGRHVAIAFVNTFCLASRAEPSKNVSEMLRADFESQLCCKAAVAMRLLPLENPIVRKLLLRRFMGRWKRKVRAREKQCDQEQAQIREGARVGMIRIMADLGIGCQGLPSYFGSDKSPAKSP